MSGPKIAAIYGLIPNQLGFCGPQQELLKKFIIGELSIPAIIPTLEKFEAAYEYYRLIARKNKIASPFNKRVVEAYWLGNELLDKITTDDLRELITERFCRPGLLSKKEAKKRADMIPAGSKPHHSFHVLILGSVTGSVNFIGDTKLKDTCRVGWGRVQQIVIPAKAGIQAQNSEPGSRVKPGMTRNGVIGKIIINYNPLIGNKTIKFGKSIKKTINWDKEILPSIEVGDWISFHWNYAIQRLNEENIVNLHRYTQNTLNTLYGKK